VRDYVVNREITQQFLSRLEEMIADLLPAYQAEGRSYLTIAIGCTGGRHRSVACAEDLAGRLAARGVATGTTHRDIGI
jgi:UPF0042 nucleotide-binding protein